MAEPYEPVTDSEVRALIERFGERQALAHGQPTVRDVAEALQVAPSTVAEMLRELREANGQDELRQRLDRLEAENAELRDRTVYVSGFHTPFADASVRRPFMFAMVASLVVVAVATFAVFGDGPGVWPKQFGLMLLAFLPLYLLGRLLFGGNRRQ